MGEVADRTQSNELQQIVGRLAAEFGGQVSTETIWQCIDNAVQATSLFGDRDEQTYEVIETVVRADLRALTNIGRGRSAEGRKAPRM